MQQIFKYYIKVFYSYDKSYFKELSGVINLSLSQTLNSLQSVAKVRVARDSFKIAPEFVKIECSHFETLILKVSEVLAVGDKSVDIIAKTELNLPTSISKYGEFGLVCDNSEFKGELDTEVLVQSFEIASIDDIENKLVSMGIKFYPKGDKVVFDSEFGVNKEANLAFMEDNIISLNINQSKNEPIKEIIFNATSENDLFATPKITLVLDPSPQPITPLQDQVWTNEENGDRYIISPITGIGKIFTSLKGSLSANIELKFDDNYVAVEEFELEDDDFVELTGYIKALNAVTLNGNTINFTFGGESGNFYKENFLCFSGRKSGLLRVSYVTECYFFSTPPSEKESTKPILLNFYNAEIDYKHKYELNGYYPLGLEHKLSIIKDFNYDSDFIPNAKIRFNGVVLNVDSFGEVDLVFNDYGNYEATLLIDNIEQKTLYISYFANEFKKDFNQRSDDDDNT